MKMNSQSFAPFARIRALLPSIASSAAKVLSTFVVMAALLHGSPAAANAPGLNITVTPNPGIYPDTRVFFSNFADFTVTNISASTLTITQLDTGGSTVFVVDSIPSVVTTCSTGTQMAPGDTCIFNVQFTPTTVGPQSALLTIGVDAPDTVTVSLFGNGGTMLGTVTPTAGAVFPATAVGVAATPIDLTMTNVGTMPIIFQPDLLHLDLSIPADFGFSGNCLGATVNAGSSCTMTVTFTPTTTGPLSYDASSLFNQVTNGSFFTNTSISITGTGVAAVHALSASPSTSLAFGAQPIGTFSAAQQIDITNTGNTPLTINSVSTPADFLITNNCPLTPSTLAVGVTCSVLVNLHPSAVGSLTNTLQILSDASSSPNSFTLTGTGLPLVSALSANPPSSLAFGAQPIGTFSAAQQIDITSTGSSPLTISAVSLTAGSRDYLLTNNCPISPSTLAVGMTCSVLVNLHPSVTGAVPGTLQITSDAPSSPNNFSLTGTGLPALAPVYSPSATSFTFAAQQIGTPSVGQALTITNTGTASMSILSISSTAPEYAFTHNCPVPAATLGAGQSCTVNITFTPSAAGSRPGSISINTDATGSPHSITLSGSGTAAPVSSVTLNPPTLSFGSQGVGTTSASKQSVLTNSGSAALTIQSIAGLGDFGFVSNCPLAPATIGPGSSCSIDVTFSPLSIGSQSASIAINDDGPGSPHGVGLTGQGVQIPVPAISVAGGPLTFGDRVVGSISPVQSVTVSNTGQANLNLSSIVVSGSAFQRVTASPASSDCGAVVAPQASCQIALVFAPNAVGALGGSVAIHHNASTATVTIALSGNGTPVPQPLIRMSPALAFGDQIIATTSAAQVVTITNGGTVPMAVSAVALSGANATDFATVGNCVTTIAPNASCSLNISFAPAGLGVRTAVLSVTSNAQNAAGNSSVNLSGNGVPVPKPEVRLSATTIGFGNVIYGSTPVAQALTLSNAGTAPLVILGISTSGNSDFTQTSTCGTGLAAQAQCTISLRFSPHALGARSGTVTIRSNADGSPHSVQMSGTGCRYFSPAAARFFLTSC